MNILLLPSFFPTASAPDRAPYVLDYARSVALAHDVVVVYPQRLGSLGVPEVLSWEEKVLGDRLRVITYGYRHIPKTWLIPYLAAYRRVLRLIRSEWRIDLIFAHTALPAGFGAVLLGRLLRIPVLLVEHWGPAIDWLDWTPSPRALQRQALVKTYAGADYLATVSAALGLDIADVFGVAHDGVLPNPVDFQVFNADGGRAVESRRVVCVTRGGDDPRKDVPNLLDAWSILVRRGADLRLDLIGPRTGGIASEVCERGLQATCTVHDWMPPAEVARRFRGASAVVIPSRYETFGRTGVEALACGTPVVATRCGGPEEYVSPDSGILVDPGDPEGLAEALLAVVQRDRFARPAELSGRIRAVYSHEAVCERFTAIAGSMVNGRP